MNRLLLALLLALSAPVSAQALKGVVTVVDTQGQAQVSLDGGKTWTAIQEGQRISPGSRVKTGPHARLALLLADRTQVRLNENTVLDVEEVGDGTRTGGQTKFRQLLGRSWVQSKTVPNGLTMRTPTATAGIRGTDWEMAVAEDGKTTLTVLSGAIDLAGEKGQMEVAANEQAVVAEGQGPAKLGIQNPRQRVQWVTAYLPDPLRHLALPPSDPVRAALAAADLNAARTLLAGQENDAAAALRILDQDLAGAYTLLDKRLAEETTQPAPWLMKADLLAHEGRLEEGLATLDAGLARFSGHPRILALKARLLLLSDQAAAATALAAENTRRHPDSPEAWLAQGDIARQEGDVATTYAAYARALQLAPDDDRAWFGKAVADGEREYVARAREGLDKALALNPRGPGYQGERGSLESFANEFAAAETAFQAALKDNPANYVAQTGLGVLRLKQGRPEDALEAFLKAGVMEPRYARAHVYTAVAYYQMGYRKQAREELARARELDDKDPLPALLDAVILNDQSRPGDALAAAREALELMPYLKSLNQVANDQRGSANLGQAFALFGMEEWARSYAQSSYNPFWAGSHLFLADRYNGLFTKNSELFQGLLSDPTVFGASNRFQSLVPAPTSNAALSMRYTRTEEMDGFSPQAELSGYRIAPVPLAYYLGYEVLDLDYDDGPYELGVATAALGVKPRHDLGLFLFLDRARQDDDSILDLASGTDLDDTLITRRADLGLHYARTPEDHWWFKASHFSSDGDTLGNLITVPIASIVAVNQPEYGFRRSFRASGQLLSFGADYALRKTDALFHSELIPGLIEEDDDARLREESLDLYLADQLDLAPNLTLDAALAWQSHRRSATETVTDYLFGIPFVNPATSENGDQTQFSPRLGLVYRLAPTRLVRVAYQNWIRPAGFSSLGPVATAGIPLDDRMVSRGGELHRLRGQVEWEFTPSLFGTGFLDYKRIHNRPLGIAPFTVSELDSLGKLRPRDLSSLMRDDLLENVDAPAFDSGDIALGGGAVNVLLDKHWSLTGRYTLADSRNTGGATKGLEVPYVPRHTVAGGVTWIKQGWTVTGLLAYRSERFADEANTQRLRPGLDGAFDVFWQAPDKHWLLRFSADNLIDKNEFAQYTLEANYRF
ncbi:MAG: TonB-dependent receptor [Pseudomonadota bacterium]